MNIADKSKAFFEEQVLGWMISDLRQSVIANTNFLTALGCLTYTEAVGAMLPSVDNETGSDKERYFYRCLFRLGSADQLVELDKYIRSETTNQQGLYQHLRHTAAHVYLPRIRRRNKDGTFSFMPVVVAKTSRTTNCPPMKIDGVGRFVIITSNFVEELEATWKSCYEKIFISKEPSWQKSVESGYRYLEGSK